jgi:hypothetical protein
LALDAWTTPDEQPAEGVVFRGTVGVDHSHFALRDSAYQPTLTLGGLAGLVTVRPCEVVLVTGTQYGLVGCTIVIAAGDPGPLLESYEDVAEAGFVSPTGVVSPASRWNGPASVPGLDLPDGPGSYRLRYHARNMDLAGEMGVVEDGIIDDYLLQVWPAPPAPREHLKVTSACGRYWAELGDVWTEAVTPPVPDGVDRKASPAGRAAATEALAADIASTYWSHLVLRPGDHVRSRRAWLVFRADGNLVVCDEDARVRWASGTAGRGAHAAFHNDGNLAVYNADGGLEWASGTQGYDGNFLAVQDDGNVVVYRADGCALWASGTNH